MSYIEVTGKTEEEAINKALSQLGLDRDDVSVEILERAKSGFLGIGSCPAKIRMTYGTDEPIVEEPKKVEKPAVCTKSEEKCKPVVSETVKPVTETVQTVAGNEVDDEKAQEIKEFLNGLMQKLDSNAVAKVYLSENDDRYHVILEGEHLGQLIGRRGETLDAIQQLTNYAVNHGASKRVRIHIDAENYRLKREQSLEHLAEKVAGKVVKYRHDMTLEPMNAYERHVIHSALQDNTRITTQSIGTEPNRRVVVKYQGNRG